MSELNRRLGRRIRQLRQTSNLTQEQLAEMADMNVTFLGQIERGAKSPTVDTLGKISDALQISLSELFVFVGDDRALTATQLKDLLLEYSDKIHQLYQNEPK